MAAGDDNAGGKSAALPPNAIAVVGMAGRFPGGIDTVEALWEALKQGRDLISRFTEEELEDSFTAEERAQPNFVKARPTLQDVEKFDAAFFGMYPREAALLDPQHRLMLEVSWEAFEDAGVDPYAYDGAIGVFASNTLNTYLIHHVLADRASAENFTSTAQLGDYTRFAGAMSDTMATRVAYKMNLRGPAMSVQSCCSSSLLAIAQACQSLILFQSDMALAGGVSITFPQKRGYHYLEGGMASADGYCRPFDADAAGTIFGHGAGAVLLKRLEDAVADGDRIYAVIRSSAINNDGADKVGYTAPSVDGQAAVIMTAHMMADVDPRSIGYIEAHGTATPMGDPIEVAGLTKAFEAGTSERQFCALGSGKGNMGHLDAAAGVVGFIKAALSVQRNEIPPLAHFKAPNPRIDFTQTPFFVADTLQAFPKMEGPRRAGVSSFGVGGTNVHVVLEEAPAVAIVDAVEDPPRIELLTIAAKSEASVNAMKAALADHLEAHPEVSLADAAFTLQTARRAFERRTTISARTREDAIAKLRASGAVAKAAESAPPVIFMFPGQGAQYPGMGKGLYESEPLFRSIVDRGAEVLKPLIGLDLRDPLYNQADAGEDTHHPIRSTILAQPALFLVEYATARLLMSWGVKPTAMVGHSVGEFVAACLSGVMKFDDALKLIAARGRLMQAQVPGAMLSIRLPEAEARAHLGDDVDIAAINGPGLVVAAGPFAAIEALEARLTEKGVQHRRLHTSHAFHSRMMDGALAPLMAEAQQIKFSAPKIPYASGLTGQWATEAEACDPNAWASHCRETVRFADALATACEGKKPILIEVGAGKTLSMLAAQIVAKDKLAGIVNTLPDVSREPEDGIVIADAVGRVWALGAAPAFEALRSPNAKRVDLPKYRWDKQRHFIDAPARAAAAAPAAPAQPDFASAFPPSAAGLFAQMPFPIAAAPQAQPAPVSSEPETSMSSQMTPEAHKAALADQLVAILEDLSGEQIAGQDPNTTFLELGFDSLFLGQVAQSIQSKFGVKLTFRQLLGDFPSVEAVSAHLATQVPIPAAAPVAAPVAQMPAAQPMQAMPQMPMQMPMGMPGMPMMPMMPMMAPGDPAAAQMLQMQMMAMQAMYAQQMAMMQQHAAAQQPMMMAPQPVAAPAPQPVAQAAPAAPAPAAKAEAEEDTTPQRFKMYRPGASQPRSELTNAQRALVEDLVALLEKRMPTSKRLTQENRAPLADPRTAAGFRAEWKELVFPIVSERSKGSRIWDIDGNEYVDVVNGYGGVAFGHAPDFVVKAVEEQLHKGFAIGPQSPMAGEVAHMLTKMLGMDRVTFCNTGSEAVMAAMRLTRAVSGKKKVVVFNNDYHGQFDEVLLRPAPKTKPPGAFPVAPGITQENVANMVVLTYGDASSLEWIKANAGEIAAVMIEPVQSRHPEIQPVEFVRELRKITADLDVALIFDEVVTGFRAHPGGMQAVWGIRADLATYGKVVGGGMPIGLLAGSSKYMDALDGGQWRYGDDSIPEVAPTFFAGTFVRHPLVLAAAKATTLHMEKHGPALQEGVAAKVKALADRLNADFARRGLTTRANQFSSFFYVAFSYEDRLGSLFYPLARSKGLSIQEGFSCFFTTEHSDADMDFIFRTFSECLDDLQSVGILPGNGAQPDAKPAAVAAAPAPQALQVAVGPTESPLTEPQTEVWLAAQLGDNASLSFNEGMTLRLDGALNLDALKGAVNDVIARHDGLRAHFSAAGDKMIIAPELKLELQTFDVSGEANPEAALTDLQQADAEMPFDLVNGPLFRAFLVKLGAEQHALVFTGHHIICDGWSVNVVLEEMSALYAARAQGASADLKRPLSYAQYATDYAKGDAQRAANEQFWLSKYKDGIPELPELPYDRARPPMKTFAGSTVSGDIDAQLYKDVKKAGAKQGCTLFATLFGAMQVLMGRLSGQSDIVLAVPTAGQSLLEDEILVGHCVNFLPFRAAFDPNAPFSAHLANVKKEVLDAFEHQDYTFGTLVRKLEVKRDVNRLPMTEIQFNLERIGQRMDLPGLKASAAPNGKAASNFDMFWNIIESENGLHIDVDYNTDILDASTVTRWIDQFRALLGGIAADATTPVKALPMMSAADRDWMMSALNNTRAPFPRDAFVHDLVSAQAAKTPDKIAATDGKHEITYASLEARSNALARQILDVAPQPGSRIAIATDRTVSMLVALVAVMKSGHAYVPLDPQHPPQRLKLILDGADVAALICDDDASEALAPAGVATLRLDSSFAETANDDNGGALPRLTGDASRPAYVIFTSGSTGAPKGVEVPHRAFVNFLLSMAKIPGFTSNDSLLSVTTISFDIAGLELFLPLIAGGKVSIASRDEVRGGFGLVERINREKPSVVQATPSLWRMLLEAGFKPSPSLKMLCGGEPLPRDLADMLIEGGAELWNMYGPTETTIWSSCGPVRKDALITIGAPIDNTQLHILDANDQLAPIGVTGDLYIGGDGLANGYFRRPDLTDGVFRAIALNGAAPQRLYKTGDVGRRLADGSIQLLGRTDQQVKLRGFRIELEDIESALRRAPGVAACAAAVREVNGDKRLVGYIVPQPGATPQVGEIAAHMAGQVPDYMVPGIWMTLEALPLTPNKKLDRKALPTPDTANAATAARNITPPRNPMEQQLADIWAEVLKVKEVGIHDNLFTLGADSLHVFRIAARMMDRGIKLEAKHLMQKPTIAELAELVAAQERGEVDTGPKTPSLRDFRGGARRRS